MLFLFIGNGPRRAAVQERAERSGLRNVRFLPPEPRESLRSSLAAADVHLACMLESLEGLVVPSKVYGAIAARRACVFLGPPGSEAARLIEDSGCGKVLAVDDGKGLAETLLLWFERRELLERCHEEAGRLADAVGLNTAKIAFRKAVTEA